MLCSSNLLKKTRLSPCRGPCCTPGQTWPRGRCPVLPFSYPHCTCSLSGMSHPPHLRPFQRGTSRCLHLGRELIPRRKRGRLPRRAAGRAAVVSAARAPGLGRREDSDGERNTASVLPAKHRCYKRKGLSLPEGRLVDSASHTCGKQKQ